MTDLLDFSQLFSETLARVRARLDADANGNWTEDDPQWVDLRQGGFYWDMTQPPAMEIARLWDAMTETAAAAFVSTAWGDYLDEHGLTFNLTRNPAVAATGQLMFVAREPTLIAAGTQASSVASLTGEVVTYQTTDSGTTCPLLAAPTNIAISPSSDGSLVEGDRFYRVSATNEFGETTVSADMAVATPANGRNTLTWDPVLGASGYSVYVDTVADSTTALRLGSTVATSFIDDGTIAPYGVMPTQNLTSGIVLGAVALTTGTIGNVMGGAITSLTTVLPTVYSVNNLDPFVNGAEQESDEDFRERILAEYQGSSGGGNQADYRRWVIGNGIERVAVVPVWDGPGTVLVVIMYTDGSPYSSDVITAQQLFLDPVPGQGAGQAPIGATVTVMTTALVGIEIVANVIPVDGYSLDGANGTIATRNNILTSISTYLNGLEPGTAVVYEHVQACFFVEGVYDISGVTVNGSTDPELPLAAGDSQNFIKNGTFTGDQPNVGEVPSYWTVVALADWIEAADSVQVITNVDAPNGRATSVVCDDSSDSQGIYYEFNDGAPLPAGTYTVSFALSSPNVEQVVVLAGQTSDAEPRTVQFISTDQGWNARFQIDFKSDGNEPSYLAFRSPTAVAMEFWIADVSTRSITVQVPRLTVSYDTNGNPLFPYLLEPAQ